MNRKCRKELGWAETGNSCLQTRGTCESCPLWESQVKTPASKRGTKQVGASRAQRDKRTPPSRRIKSAKEIQRHSLTSMLIAVEYGYRMAEKNHNLTYTLAEAEAIWKGKKKTK